MKITKLRLVNFRNYSNLDIEFSKTKNIIIGNNGEGKTNIIEAIYYLSLTKSFRTNNDDALIYDGAKAAVIEGKIKDSITNTYKISISNDKKIIKIDNNQVNKIGEYISKINTVLFNQEDLKLIKDNPGIHRKLINMELSMFDNNYMKLLSIYNKILKQRNTYLKEMLINSMIPKDYLDILTDKLIEYGFKIYELRFNFIDQINIYLKEIFANITGKENLSIKYISHYSNKSIEKIKAEYKKGFQRDLNYGKTNIGIHLDDYLFIYKDKLAKEYLSEGEQKNAIISLKLAEIEYCLKKLNKVPILMLDDLFSELDKVKINNILDYLNEDIQIFITTTDIHKVSKKLLKNCNVYKLHNGKIKVQKYE